MNHSGYDCGNSIATTSSRVLIQVSHATSVSAIRHYKVSGVVRRAADEAASQEVLRDIYTKENVYRQDLSGSADDMWRRINVERNEEEYYFKQSGRTSAERDYSDLLQDRHQLVLLKDLPHPSQLFRKRGSAGNSVDVSEAGAGSSVGVNRVRVRASRQKPCPVESHIQEVRRRAEAFAPRPTSVSLCDSQQDKAGYRLEQEPCFGSMRGNVESSIHATCLDSNLQPYVGPSDFVTEKNNYSVGFAKTVSPLGTERTYSVVQLMTETARKVPGVIMDQNYDNHRSNTEDIGSGYSQDLFDEDNLNITDKVDKGYGSTSSFQSYYRPTHFSNDVSSRVFDNDDQSAYNCLGIKSEPVDENDSSLNPLLNRNQTTIDNFSSSKPSREREHFSYTRSSNKSNTCSRNALFSQFNNSGQDLDEDLNSERFHTLFKHEREVREDEVSLNMHPIASQQSDLQGHLDGTSKAYVQYRNTPKSPGPNNNTKRRVSLYESALENSRHFGNASSSFSGISIKPEPLFDEMPCIDKDARHCNYVSDVNPYSAGDGWYSENRQNSIFSQSGKASRLFENFKTPLPPTRKRVANILWNQEDRLIHSSTPLREDYDGFSAGVHLSSTPLNPSQRVDGDCTPGVPYRKSRISVNEDSFLRSESSSKSVTFEDRSSREAFSLKNGSHVHEDGSSTVMQPLLDSSRMEDYTVGDSQAASPERNQYMPRICSVNVIDRDSRIPSVEGVASRLEGSQSLNSHCNKVVGEQTLRKFQHSNISIPSACENVNLMQTFPISEMNQESVPRLKSAIPLKSTRYENNSNVSVPQNTCKTSSADVSRQNASAVDTLDNFYQNTSTSILESILDPTINRNLPSDQYTSRKPPSISGLSTQRYELENRLPAVGWKSHPVLSGGVADVTQRGRPLGQPLLLATATRRSTSNSSSSDIVTPASIDRSRGLVRARSDQRRNVGGVMKRLDNEEEEEEEDGCIVDVKRSSSCETAPSNSDFLSLYQSTFLSKSSASRRSAQTSDENILRSSSRLSHVNSTPLLRYSQLNSSSMSRDNQLNSAYTAHSSQLDTAHLSRDNQRNSAHLSHDNQLNSAHLSRDNQLNSAHLSRDNQLNSAHLSRDNQLNSAHLSHAPVDDDSCLALSRRVDLASLLREAKGKLSSSTTDLGALSVSHQVRDDTSDLLTTDLDPGVPLKPTLLSRERTRGQGHARTSCLRGYDEKLEHHNDDNDNNDDTHGNVPMIEILLSDDDENICRDSAAKYQETDETSTNNKDDDDDDSDVLFEDSEAGDDEMNDELEEEEDTEELVDNVGVVPYVPVSMSRDAYISTDKLNVSDIIQHQDQSKGGYVKLEE